MVTCTVTPPTPLWVGPTCCITVESWTLLWQKRLHAAVQRFQALMWVGRPLVCLAACQIHATTRFIPILKNEQIYRGWYGYYFFFFLKKTHLINNSSSGISIRVRWGINGLNHNANNFLIRKALSSSMIRLKRKLLILKVDKSYFPPSGFISNMTSTGRGG